MPKSSDWNFKPPATASAASADPWLRLASAIVLQAGIEGREGDPGALFWLASDDCGLICFLLGIDRRAVFAKVEEWAARRNTGRTGKRARKYIDPGSAPAGKIVIRMAVASVGV